MFSFLTWRWCTVYNNSRQFPNRLTPNFLRKTKTQEPSRTKFSQHPTIFYHGRFTNPRDLSQFFFSPPQKRPSLTTRSSNQSRLPSIRSVPRTYRFYSNILPTCSFFHVSFFPRSYLPLLSLKVASCTTLQQRFSFVGQYTYKALFFFLTFCTRTLSKSSERPARKYFDGTGCDERQSMQEWSDFSFISRSIFCPRRASAMRRAGKRSTGMTTIGNERGERRWEKTK